MTELDPRAVGAGIALGAGVGTTIGLLADQGVALGAGYGIAIGIIVGTFLARLAPRLADNERPLIALGVGGLALGAVIGGVVGAIAAWGVDATIPDGVQAGIIGGGRSACSSPGSSRPLWVSSDLEFLT